MPDRDDLEPGRTPLHLVVRRPVDALARAGLPGAGRNLTVDEWATYIGGPGDVSQWPAPAAT